MNIKLPPHLLLVCALCALSGVRAAERGLWTEQVGTTVPTPAGEFRATFGDQFLFTITVGHPSKIFADRIRGWPFALGYRLNATDGDSSFYIAFREPPHRKTDEELAKSTGSTNIARRTIRVGSQGVVYRDIVFREWSDAERYYCDTYAHLEVGDGYWRTPIIIEISATSKERRQALEQAMRSARLEGRTGPFPPAVAPGNDAPPGNLPDPQE